MGRHSTAIPASVPLPTESPSPSPSPSRKRKRDDVSTVVEIEVNVSAPEPPSKKALRRAKKSKASQTTTTKESGKISVDPDVEREEQADTPAEYTTPANRSEFGIWIGNLPWTATKQDLHTFLTNNTTISDDMISRTHMPPPSKAAVGSSMQRIKPLNKGFAYVDFTTQAALDEAVSLSEKLFTGRRVLIKHSKSFEGRPDSTREADGADAHSGKPPSKRIFVGNLGFDTTKEDLQEHFARCGEVLDVHTATFEDSGKCKGYAWVEFAELEAGRNAVRGWVGYEPRAEQESDFEKEDEDRSKSKKKPKVRKWWVNKLQGRPLRMEFAEDKAVRYKKRYGKDGSMQMKGTEVGVTLESPAEPTVANHVTPPRPLMGNYKGQNASRKLDARNIKPGAALAAAPRLTGGIVQSTGKKVVFA